MSAVKEAVEVKEQAVEVKEQAVEVKEQAVEVKRKVGRPVTKATLKRVVLLNGKVVGRGRPKTDGKSERTVVYIPIGETYDVSKHGAGVKFSPGLKQFRASIKRVDLKKFDALVKQTA